MLFNTFVFLCMVYACLCAHLYTHIGLPMCRSQRLILNVSLHFSPHYAFRQGISLILRITDSARISGQWSSEILPSLPSQSWDSRQAPWTSAFNSNAADENTSLQAWIVSTSWLEPSAQAPLHCLNGQRLSFCLGCLSSLALFLSGCGVFFHLTVLSAQLFACSPDAKSFASSWSLFHAKWALKFCLASWWWWYIDPKKTWSLLLN